MTNSFAASGWRLFRQVPLWMAGYFLATPFLLLSLAFAESFIVVATPVLRLLFRLSFFLLSRHLLFRSILQGNLHMLPGFRDAPTTPPATTATTANATTTTTATAATAPTTTTTTIRYFKAI
eukprot:GHVT01042523.1.p1 GENE.GHVT01042523.1~~GHVT01042523.1.p1  ORF type:complete len:122 (+),score=30.68 GHVT01042523.1:407-772(+)